MKTKTPKVAVKQHIRWQIRRDMPEVLRIESDNFEFPWCEDDFIRCLRQRNCIGMVMQRGGDLPGDGPVIGFMVYELHKNRLHILNFAVHKDFHRQGVGTAMVRKLASKLSPQRRSRILIEVRETNTDAAMFFKACGFRAISLLRNFYDDSGEDCYLMQYRYVHPAAEPTQ